MITYLYTTTFTNATTTTITIAIPTSILSSPKELSLTSELSQLTFKKLNPNSSKYWSIHQARFSS